MIDAIRSTPVFQFTDEDLVELDQLRERGFVLEEFRVGDRIIVIGTQENTDGYNA